MSKVIAIKSEAEFKEYLNKKGTVLADFKATWCGPCKMLGPVLVEVAAEMPEVTFLEIDVDDNQGLAQEYKIQSIPALKVFKDGKLVKESLGFLPKAKIEELVK